MSGMAIVLLCAMQVDNSGWRSTPGQSPVPPSGAVRPAGASSPWGGTDDLVERAEGALRDGVTRAQEYLRGPATQPGGPSGARTGSGANLTGTGWPEIEQAVGQPLNQVPRSTAADQSSLRKRIRGPGVEGSLAPSPPTSSLPNGGSRYGGNTRGIELPAARTYTATQPRDTLPPLGPSFPQPPSGGFDEATAGTAPAREVVFEGELTAPDQAQRRYLNPPGRAGESRLAAERRAASRPPSQPAAQDATTSGAAFQLPAPPESAETAEAARDATVPPKVPATSERAWAPLLLSVLGLFGSLGFNLYLGWIAWDLYSRYQDAVDDVQELETKLEAKQQELAAGLGSRPGPRHSAILSA